MLNRRDMGVLSASGLACAFLGLNGCDTAQPHVWQPHVWQGQALGAPSSVKLYGVPLAKAKELFLASETEITRLKNIFSLSDTASEISGLNQHGVLEHASPEMIEVLQTAAHISDLTHGAFDITVQSLWNTAKHLTRVQISQEGIKQLWAKAYDLVDYTYVKINGRHVSFTKPDVTITLNGLAQGYITDKITQLLLRSGARSGLVNIGEYRAFGTKTWKLGVQDPRNIMDVIDIISLKSAGLATSSATGGYLSAEMSHIFEPRTGHNKPQFISASVVHKSAIMADGLATAFTLLDEGRIRNIAKKANVHAALLMREDGEIIRI